jgi:hypothetical protein
MERQREAEKYGIIANIGKKVMPNSGFSFRSNDTAKIIGWGLSSEDNQPLYFIKFDNGECDSIPARKLFYKNGFFFVKNDFSMTTMERQREAEKHGIIANIGKKVIAVCGVSFRYDDMAEIVGWGLRFEDNRPLYFIKFDNGECDSIPAGKLFCESGYSFVN